MVSHSLRVSQTLETSSILSSGIFGDYVQDDIVVQAGKQTYINATWVPESAGTELWRIGVPDKSAGGVHLVCPIHVESLTDPRTSNPLSGEFKNGLERDFTHPRQPSSKPPCTADALA